MRLLGLMLIVAFLVEGCAYLQSIFAPPPPPPPPRTAPPAPPPVLSPELGRADEDRLRREVSSKIQKTEEIVQQLDQNKLSKEQQETVSTIQSFLTTAKGSLSARDFLRAANLAEKARILAEELVRGLR